MDLYPGELAVLIGPGDAGKTDLLKMILGLAGKDSGEIRVIGHSPGSREALQQVGVVLDRVDFPSAMKAGEVIDLVRTHFSDPVSTDELVERCRLQDQIEKSIADLSNGQLRWLAILLSLVNRPSVLVMDEPLLGMDVAWRRDCWKLLTQYTQDGGLALITTDMLHEVETYADRVIIMHRGKIIASGSVHDILSNNGERTVSMWTDSLPETDGIKDVQWVEGGPRLLTSDSDEVVQALQEQEVDYEGLEVRRPSLEEVVLALIEAEDDQS